MAPALFWFLLFSVLTYAFVRGGTEHKLAAIGCVVASLASNIVRPYGSPNYDRLESGLLWVDIGLLVLFVAIAMRSSRFWPLWVAGFHLVTVASHGFRVVRWDLVPTAYALAAQFWSYPVLLVIAVAVWRGHRREIAALLARENPSSV